MNFGAECYVPVLKVKRGEKSALAAIGANPSLCKSTIPLLEIVERTAVNLDTGKPKAIGDHLDTAFSNLDVAVGNYPRFMLDAHEIAPDGPAAAVRVFKRAADAKMVFTPVTGVSRTADVAAALTNRRHGICIRLTREEFERGNIPRELTAFLSRHELRPAEVDLVIDLGEVCSLVKEGVTALTNGFLGVVPNHNLWRTFTVVGCAFPSTMAEVDRNSHRLVERTEWLAWRDDQYANRKDLIRLPTYGDYAIQNLRGVEGFNPLFMPISAAIRYALEKEWLLIKGESTRATLASKQFPALAHELVYGEYKTYYLGSKHCQGCLDIKRSADGESKLGSAEVWRRLGTIHHLAMAIDGLAALSWP